MLSTTRLAWLPTFLGVLALATAGQAQDPTREKRIDEIRKQIDDLRKSLDTLTKPSAEVKGVAPSLGPAWVKPLSWRSIGPAGTSGRVVALAVVDDDPAAYWVGTAGGGLLRTTNNGTTFEHQFDRAGSAAVGDVCVAPSDRNVVWVGTGENNPRNSVSYGDGVYKSIDGGKSWTCMGLKGTYQIGRIAIHPRDPDVVYVGALGRLYGPSEERGLFKTTDGGATWKKILYVDDKTGVVDLQMHPSDPETLLVATYERLRDLYDAGDPVKKYGPGSALYKTTDAGKTFRKLTRGLPTVNLGRVGLDYFRKDPNTVFAIVESEKIGTGLRPKTAPRPGQPQAYVGITGEGPEAPGAAISGVTPGGPAQKAGLKPGDLIKEVDGKSVKSFNDFAALVRDKKVGDALKMKVEREGKPIEVVVTLEPRPAEPGRGPGPPENESGGLGLGLSPDRPFGSVLGGQIENAQDRQGADGFQTGGVYKSTDGGESWTRVNSLNPRPFYFSQVRVDPKDDQSVYVLGLALHHSADGGKTFRGDAGRGVHPDHHALWIDPRDGRHVLLGGDGGPYVSYDRGANWDHLNHVAIGQFYHVAVDTNRLYKVYGGLQDNGTWGGPTLSRSGDGPINEDWINVGSGDGFHCQVDPTDADLVYWSSQYGGLARRNLRTGENVGIVPVAEKGKRHRFNWNTPFLLSSHNPKIYYTAGDVVFRSLNAGNDLRPISPPISRTERGTASALAESPRNPDVLYVGTDDGALWVTRDGGKSWSDVSKTLGLDRPCFVATIEASRAVEGRAYVALDGHRSDTDEPLVFVTEDFGQSWAALKANLPRGSTRCLREDPVNHDLLYLGTEFAVWASLDRGRLWLRINANLPTVAVLELVAHPTAGEVVAATHGRSLWVLDVSGLRQLTPVALQARAALLKPQGAVLWHREPRRGGTNRRFVGQNPPRGAQIDVAVTAKAESARLKILDFEGATVYETRVPTEPGLHRLSWPLNRPAPAASAGGPLGRLGGTVLRRVPLLAAAPGKYRVVLTVDGQEWSQPLAVEPDPAYPNAPTLVRGSDDSEDEEDDEEREAMEADAHESSNRELSQDRKENEKGK